MCFNVDLLTTELNRSRNKEFKSRHNTCLTNRCVASVSKRTKELIAEAKNSSLLIWLESDKSIHVAVFGLFHLKAVLRGLDKDKVGSINYLC